MSVPGHQRTLRRGSETTRRAICVILRRQKH
jgi:hypothetical protein